MSVTTGQVTTLLENVLFESPTVAAANTSTWVANSGIAGQDTVAGLAAAMAATAEGGIPEQVVRYYIGALGRIPSGSEVQFYVNTAEQGLSAAQIAAGTSAVPTSTWTTIATYFADSPEFTHDFGLSGAGVVNSSNEALVITAFYTNILNRAPAPSDITFYEGVLNGGTSLPVLIEYFTNSPEYQASVNSSLGTALASYGTSVANGTTPAQIPFFLPGQVISDTLTSSALTVTGTSTSTTVTVTGTPAQAAQAAVTAVTGVIAVAPVTAATGVQGVTGVTGVASVAGQTAQSAVTDGAVTINDANSSTTGAGSITTVTLIDSGAGSVINDNGLTSLTLTGTTGTLAITDSNSAAIAAHTSTLALTLNGLTAPANTITDTNNEIGTLTVTTATADSVLAGFVDSHLAILNVSGTNKLTLDSINSSLTNLNVSDGASFSDGATTHSGGLAARGSNIAISVTSSGTFSAAIDDTSQNFTGSSGADTIIVSALADATHTITAGSATNNEIIFEGGGYVLSSASAGKFVNFQTVGVAANVTGTIDLSVVDPTASTLEVLGNSGNIVFTKVASGAALLLDPSSGATVTVSYADSTGASDSAAVTMSSAVTGLTLHDAVGVGIATLTIANNLASTETIVSAAHSLGTLTDTGLSTLNVNGDAGLVIGSLAETVTGFTLNDGSTDGYGVTITTLTDTALASFAFAGSGVSSIGTLNTAVASFAVTNNGTTVDSVGTISDNSLTSLSLAANIALGQAATAQTSNGLQDGSTAGVTVSGGSDNAHITVNLTAGAASGATDTVTLGNGNNIVVDGSSAGTVNITLGTGANLVELGTGSLDTTAHYSVTLSARTATPPNAIVVGAAGTNYATAPNIVISGATTGDNIVFGNDSSSLGGGALTATSLTGQSSVAGAIAALETAVTGATNAHKVVYGVYGGNTYIVETITGTVGATDTAVIEVTGSQTLFASLGYVTLGSAASSYSGGGLSGAGFTIPAGTATNLTLGVGGSVVTLVGPTAGVTDNFTAGANAGGLTINYQATAASTGNDTINVAGGANITGLVVNDTSSGSAGLTIGAFTANNLASATYNNSAATGAVMTQSALTSSSLTNIALTGGVSGQTTNTYFISAALSTTGTVSVNDSNVGLGTTTMGLTLSAAGGLTVAMSGPGTLATGALSDNSLAALTIHGSGAGGVNIGTLTDTTTGGFTVTDDSSATGASSGAVIVLAGLSKASSLTFTDSSAGTLTDSSSYVDNQMTGLTLTNTGSAALSVGTGAGGITANLLTSITIDPLGTGAAATGTITTGIINDSVTGTFTVTDDSPSSAAVTLPLEGLSAASTLKIIDNSPGALSLLVPLSTDTLSDNLLTALSVSIGSSTGAVNFGSLADTVAGGFTFTDSSTSTTTLALNVTSLPNATSFTVMDSAKGALTIGAFTDDDAAAVMPSGGFPTSITNFPTASLTFSNTGSSALTIDGITDDAAVVAMHITGSGTGTQAITLIDPAGAGATALYVTDDSTSTGATALVTTLTGGPAALQLYDNASAALTMSDVGAAALSDANLVDVALTNTGAGLLTLSTITNSSAAIFSTLLIEGTGPVSSALSVGNNTGNVEVGDGDSANVTLSSIDVGSTVTDAGSLIIAHANSGSGSFTVSGGTVYVTGIAIANTSNGVNNVTLTDPDTGALTVLLTGSGAQALTLTDSTAITQISQNTGDNGNIALNFSYGAMTSDEVTLNNGNNTVSLSGTVPIALILGTGHNVITLPSGVPGNAVAFFGALGSNVNVSPVTADIINNFALDTSTPVPSMGDEIVLLFNSSNIITNSDTNAATSFWTASAGMLSKSGASVLNFIAEVQSLTTAAGAAANGIAGFLDGKGNTWLAYNDHSGSNVAVIELVGVTATGIESGSTFQAGYIHIG